MTGQQVDGDPRVSAALERLAGLAGLPLAEQVDVFTDIQARLSAVLADSATSG